MPAPTQYQDRGRTWVDIDPRPSGVAKDRLIPSTALLNMCPQQEVRRAEGGAINNSTSSDQLSDLLARCALGDQAAFARLYQESSGKLFGIAIRILRDSRAEEVLQEAFVKIWHRAGDYRADKGAAMTWMASIVRNRALDILRRPNLETALDDEDRWESDIPGPLERAIHSTEARALMRCLEQLESAQRQAVTLAFFHGLAHADLARHLNQPLGTIKSWIRRGLQRLRGCLET